MPSKAIEEETHPFILFFSIILGITLLLSGILFLTWKILRKIKFSKILEESELTVMERGMLMNSITRQRISDPFKVISEQTTFDYFSNTVARYYLSLDLPVDDLRKEGLIFHKTREKLNFKHCFNSEQITSSRCLTPGIPISVSFSIEETKHTFQFLSRVLENNDFFFSIQPSSDHEIQDLLQSDRKILVEIRFSRSQDAQYYFYSHYIKVYLTPAKNVVIYAL